MSIITKDQEFQKRQNESKTRIAEALKRIPIIKACPMRIVVIPKETTPYNPCLQEKCMWFDSGGNCAVLNIAKWLSDISVSLDSAENLSIG